MEENSIIKDKKDKMLMIVIGCLSVVLILLFIFFLVERSEIKNISPPFMRKSNYWNRSLPI